MGRYRHLDHAVGVGTQKLYVTHLNGMPTADRTDNARHGIGMAATIERRARAIDVDAVQRRCEAVGVALTPHLAVGDNVEPRALLVADGEDRGVVLRLLEEFRRNAPQLLRPHARRKAAGKLLTIDQPFGLGIGPHQRCWQERNCPSLNPGQAAIFVLAAT